VASTAEETIKAQDAHATQQWKDQEALDNRRVAANQAVDEQYGAYTDLDNAHKHQGAIGRFVEGAANTFNVKGSYNNTSHKINNNIEDVDYMYTQVGDLNSGAGNYFNDSYKTQFGFNYDPKNPYVTKDDSRLNGGKIGGEIGESNQAVKDYNDSQKKGMLAFSIVTGVLAGAVAAPIGGVAGIVAGAALGTAVSVGESAIEDNTRGDGTHDMSVGDYFKEAGIGMAAGLGGGALFAGAGGAIAGGLGKGTTAWAGFKNAFTWRGAPVPLANEAPSKFGDGPEQYFEPGLFAEPKGPNVFQQGWTNTKNFFNNAGGGKPTENPPVVNDTSKFGNGAEQYFNPGLFNETQPGVFQQGWNNAAGFVNKGGTSVKNNWNSFVNRFGEQPSKFGNGPEQYFNPSLFAEPKGPGIVQQGWNNTREFFNNTGGSLRNNWQTFTGRFGNNQPTSKFGNGPEQYFEPGLFAEPKPSIFQQGWNGTKNFFNNAGSNLRNNWNNFTNRFGNQPSKYGNGPEQYFEPGLFAEPKGPGVFQQGWNNTKGFFNNAGGSLRNNWNSFTSRFGNEAPSKYGNGPEQYFNPGLFAEPKGPGAFQQGWNGTKGFFNNAGGSLRSNWNNFTSRFNMPSFGGFNRPSFNMPSFGGFNRPSFNMPSFGGFSRPSFNMPSFGFNNFGNKFSQGWNSFTGGLNSFGNKFSQGWNGFTGGLGNKFSQGWNSFTGGLNSFGNKFTQSWKNFTAGFKRPPNMDEAPTRPLPARMDNTPMPTPGQQATYNTAMDQIFNSSNPARQFKLWAARGGHTDQGGDNAVFQQVSDNIDRYKYNPAAFEHANPEFTFGRGNDTTPPVEVKPNSGDDITPTEPKPDTDNVPGNEGVLPTDPQEPPPVPPKVKTDDEEIDPNFKQVWDNDGAFFNKKTDVTPTPEPKPVTPQPKPLSPEKQAYNDAVNLSKDYAPSSMFDSGGAAWLKNINGDVIKLNDDYKLAQKLLPNGPITSNLEQRSIGDCSKLAISTAMIKDPTGKGAAAILQRFKFTNGIGDPKGGIDLNFGQGYTIHFKPENVNAPLPRATTATSATPAEGDLIYKLLEAGHLKNLKYDAAKHTGSPKKVQDGFGKEIDKHAVNPNNKSYVPGSKIENKQLYEYQEPQLKNLGPIFRNDKDNALNHPNGQSSNQIHSISSTVDNLDGGLIGGAKFMDRLLNNGTKNKTYTPFKVWAPNHTFDDVFAAKDGAQGALSNPGTVSGRFATDLHEFKMDYRRITNNIQHRQNNHYAIAGTKPNPAVDPKLGDQAPPFKIIDANGHQVDLVPQHAYTLRAITKQQGQERVFHLINPHNINNKELELPESIFKQYFNAIEGIRINTQQTKSSGFNLPFKTFGFKNTGMPTGFAP